MSWVVLVLKTTVWFAALLHTHVIKENHTLTGFCSGHTAFEHCYANGNDLISFNIKNVKTKATLTHMYIELVIRTKTIISV